MFYFVENFLVKREGNGMPSVIFALAMYRTKILDILKLKKKKGSRHRYLPNKSEVNDTSFFYLFY